MNDVPRFDWKTIAAIVAVGITLLAVFINFVVEVREASGDVKDLAGRLSALDARMDSGLGQVSTMESTYTSARMLIDERVDLLEGRVRDAELDLAAAKEWRRIQELQPCR